jgi:hypothetical protein
MQIMPRKDFYRAALVVCVSLFLLLLAACENLDEAYDVGGPGQGRTIDTDAGPVQLSGPGGLIVESTTETGVLIITGGADIAEPFLITGVGPIIPGQVVVIDESNPGRLRVSDRAYDTMVAGVIAGAGDLSPGLTLTGMNQGDNTHQVALTGLVYVLADASNGEIRPGDILTSSDKAGHAMRAQDDENVHGAVLGKAMGSLQEGQDLVLMLVSLL